MCRVAANNQKVLKAPQHISLFRSINVADFDSALRAPPVESIVAAFVSSRPRAAR
jgi:hypothetical protein